MEKAQASAGASPTAQPTGDTSAQSWTFAVAVKAPTASVPVADFTGTPLSGTGPLSVVFTDASTNTPTSWAWTFGDGGTSTAQNPSHSYTTAGTYTVVLVATNSAGSNTLTRTGYVTVSDQPRPIRINTSQGWADIGDASSFVSGSGAPTVAQGATGAIYLDSATGLHYGPKAGGAWPGAALPVPAGTPSDATTSAKGVVQLAGDLAGTAASPQIAAGVIVNADVNAAAALARSKLDFGTGLVNSDIATAAAIAKTKLAALAIVDTDVAAGAAIAEAKLSLASDAVAGTASRRTLGSGATQAAAGNDPRFPILATTPPGSPVDGQEWLLQASGCPTWLFRYNSSNATAYKWEFIGGAVLNSTENIDQVVPTGTPTVFGPLFAVPRPGYWLLRHFSVAYMSSAPPANSYFIATLSTYPSYGILSGAVANAVGISAVNNEMPNAIEQTVLLASAQSVGIGLMASGANVTSRRRMHSLQPVNIS
jgi:PKD repeat protein